MKREGYQGATFGIMEGIIMALGLIMGLSAIENKAAIVAGILVAALADAFANAAGFHVSEETETYHTRREIWKSTIFCFFTTITVILLLAVPVFFMPIAQAIIVSELIGIVILALLGYYVGGIGNKKRFNIIIEYVLIGVVVSVICYYLGNIVIYYIAP